MVYNTANVGIAILIKNNKGQILLGQRISKLGNGTWAPPGGKLEKGETIEDSIIRETKEETGMILKTMKFNCITNDIFDEDTHFVTIYMDAIEIYGFPTLMEPDKCVEWKYFDLNNLPENLFLCFKNFIEGKKYN
jgi:8-oxo-dGTP diphosphatase